MTFPNTSIPNNAVWFVTGASTGIGFSLISSILSTPGHRIVILSRTPSTITLPSTSNDANTLLQSIDLKSSTSIAAAFKAALDKFGRIDVVINNAGYGIFGEFESITDETSRELFEVNYWAPVQITRLAMGIMRDINPKTGPVGGVIAQVSSAGGYVGVAGLSPYSASKFALEGFTEAVSKEPDSAWNIRFAIFEPGSVKTQWSGGNMDRESKQHEAYVGKGLATDTIKDMRTAFEEKTGADPDIVSDLMVAVLKGEKGNWDGRDLLRLPITASGFAVVRTEAARQLRLFDEWKDISESVSSVEVIETLKGLGMLKE